MMSLFFFACTIASDYGEIMKTFCEECGDGDFENALCYRLSENSFCKAAGRR
jgi:hypothetical protein